MYYLSIHFHPFSARELSELSVVSEMTVLLRLGEALATQDEDWCF